jgi:hypothetical protein
MTAPQPSRSLLPAGGRSGGGTDQREPEPESVTPLSVGCRRVPGRTHRGSVKAASSLSVRQCHSLGAVGKRPGIQLRSYPVRGRS